MLRIIPGKSAGDVVSTSNTQTWGSGAAGTIVWTFDTTGTDQTLTADGSNNRVSFNGIVRATSFTTTGAAPGVLDLDTGVVGVGAAATVRFGANTGSVASVSEAGGAVTPIIIGTRANFPNGVATDDNIFLGDGTTWQRVALPNCTDVSGQHLNYTAATNTLSCGTSGGGANHNILSATHPDSTVGTVARGDLIVGQGVSPTWQRLAIGASGTYHRSDGTDATWSTIVAADLPATVVRTNQANTYTTGAQSFASATSVTVPSSAGVRPTADGSVAYDTTQEAYVVGGTQGGSTTQIGGFLPRFFTDGVALGPSDTLDAGTIGTTETAHATTTYALPANYFTVGKTLLIYFNAQYVTPASATSFRYTLRVQKAGPTNVNLFQGAGQTPTASQTNGSGQIVFITCRTTGATGTVDVGIIGGQISRTILQPNQVTQPVTIDTTAAQTIQITITFGAGTAGNTSTIRMMHVGEFN